MNKELISKPIVENIYENIKNKIKNNNKWKNIRITIKHTEYKTININKIKKNRKIIMTNRKY